MSGVVLRCPNCGTAQSTEGECEACREAPVRYFCTNHAPGVWIDSPSCPQCGARFGDPEPARVPPPPPERPRPRPPRTLEPDPARVEEDYGPWGSPAGGPGPGAPRPSPDLGSLVAAMLGAAARSRRGRGEPASYEDYEAAPPRRRRGSGCLGRLLMLLLLLFALFLLAPFLLGALLNFG